MLFGLQSQAWRVVANKRIKKLAQAIYKPGAHDYLIAARKT